MKYIILSHNLWHIVVSEIKDSLVISKMTGKGQRDANSERKLAFVLSVKAELEKI